LTYSTVVSKGFWSTVGKEAAVSRFYCVLPLQSIEPKVVGIDLRVTTVTSGQIETFRRDANIHNLLVQQ